MAFKFRRQRSARHLKVRTLKVNENQVHSEHKETIMHGHDCHNTTILSIIHVNYKLHPILFLAIVRLDKLLETTTQCIV